MSDTPRTNAATQCCNTHPDYVHAEFARTLERELANTQKELESVRLEFQAACDHDWEKVDASFSHEFGTEVIHYQQCEKCGKRAEWDDIEHDDSDPPERDDDEPNYDAPKPLTPLENHQRNDEHSPNL